MRGRCASRSHAPRYRPRRRSRRSSLSRHRSAANYAELSARIAFCARGEFGFEPFEVAVDGAADAQGVEFALVTAPAVKRVGQYTGFGQALQRLRLGSHPVDLVLGA